MADLASSSDLHDLAIAVFRANGAIIARGDRLVADLNLTSALWQVLDALQRLDQAATVAGIARSMGLRRQSVQRSTDLLFDRGLVAFVGNPADQRAKLVRLTTAGAEALAAIDQRERIARAGVLARIGAEEVATAARVLTAYASEMTRQLKAENRP